METLMYVSLALAALSAVILIVVVLFQSGKSAGLSGAIAGGSDSFFSKNGGKGLDAKLAKATKWLGLAFVILTLISAILTRAVFLK